ncbi:MAG: hypothetical protein PHV13_04315 [Candidatus ainarchaeum sp.]|nr:hypothetical protein [Candidatus ainarchaeum sp.]
MDTTTDTARNGIYARLREFKPQRLLGIAKINGSPALRIAAGLELVERTSDANALIGWAFDVHVLLAPVREAAGLKAVTLTNDVDALITWASGFDLPASASIAAGKKAIETAIKQKNRDAVVKLRFGAVSGAVQTAASNALGRRVWPNTLAKDGVLSKGTVPAPASPIPRERRAILAR